MIAAFLLAACNVLGVDPWTGVAEYYGSDELKAEVRKPLDRRTYPIERVTEADRAAALAALKGVKTIAVWNKDTAWVWDGAFEGAPDLERVVLMSGVTAVGNRAFADCPKFTTVISECNRTLDFSEDAFAGVTNTLTLIHCGRDNRHGVLAAEGPFARVITIERLFGDGYLRYDRESRSLNFGGPFVSGNWVYTRGDSDIRDGEKPFDKAILELALNPGEVDRFPQTIDGLAVSRRNPKVVPEADANRIREAELAYARGESEGDAKYRIVDGEAHIFEFSPRDGKDGRRKEIVFPDTLGGCPVTELPRGCLSGNERVERVVLPKTLKAIPDGFCFGCPHLVTVEIPASVERIGRAAFYGDRALDLPKIPEGARVGEWAFKGREYADTRAGYTGAGGKVTVEMLDCQNVKARVEFFGRKEIVAKHSQNGLCYYSADDQVRYAICLDGWRNGSWISEAAPFDDDGVTTVGGVIPLVAESPQQKAAQPATSPAYTIGIRRHRSMPSRSIAPPILNVSILTEKMVAPPGTRCGYDLVVEDFVKPYGRGTTADLYVTAEVDPKRVTVEAGETSKGFRNAECVKNTSKPIPASAVEAMSDEPIVITATNKMCWLSFRGGWSGDDEPSGTMMYFTARGVPAALNWWFSPQNAGCDCHLVIRVNAEIVPPPPPADCDADLVETEDGTAVYYGGWAHPPVAGREVTDRDAIRRLVIAACVDEIPADAFSGLKNLEQVSFPGVGNGVRIGSRAFADCPKLRLITARSGDDGLFVEPDSFAGCASDLLCVRHANGVREPVLVETEVGWKRELLTDEYFDGNNASRLKLEGDFLFRIYDRDVDLIRSFADEETVRLPSVCDGQPVTSIEKGAFPSGGKTRKVVLPQHLISLPAAKTGAPEFVRP